ncbi:MAG: flavodoxin family protein [Brevefilum sp.]|nr:flavodoxin family protein [Brevefilum sp.]
MAEKLVVYDSVFGNTEKIAEAIGETLGDALVINVSKVTKEDLENLKILFVGSPTRAFRPMPATMNFIKGLEPNALSGVKGAAFDTRIPLEQTESGFLKFLIKLFGYADTKIAKALAKAGADLALPSEGFGVSGTEGPLLEGELERAQDWARGILNTLAYIQW